MAGSATTEGRRSLDELVQEAARQARVERLRTLGIGLVFLAVVVASASQVELDPFRLISKGGYMSRMLAGFLHPDTSIIALGSGTFREGLVEHYILQTLEIAVVGTVVGTLIAVPASFLAARNLMRRNPLGTAIYFVVRTLMSVIRSIPTLFWGLLFVTVVSLGPFPGVLAVGIFSFGLMSKLFSEAIEAIDPGQVEAMTATGANPVQVIVHGVLPQVTPYMIAHLLYTFEVNVHSATVLGIVGAGGIGFLLIQYIESFNYSATAMILVVVVAVTMIVDYSSAAIRRRII
jgi:phosphonate transport system permease protein